MKKVDYIIVGQGIAGTMLAWFLQKANQSFTIIDEDHQRSSTKIAAGIINPITGRRFVKSWRIEDLLPFAKETYQEIESATQLDLFKELGIIRFFQNIAEGNNWLSKTTYDGYEKHLTTTKLTENLDPYIKDTGGYGTVNGARVEVGKLITYYKNYYANKDQLLQETFDHKQLAIENGKVQYKNIEATKILFCEGYSACHNPWFQQLPYESAKGEAFFIKIPNFKTDYIIKKTQFLVPLVDDLFWFGSNYEWDNLTYEPTVAGKAYLEERLEATLKVDYELVAHVAAVRPILKDRRPVLGLHPKHPEIGILNGLGTKGASNAPYWAKQLVDFLVDGKELEKEVQLDRFFKL